MRKRGVIGCQFWLKLAEGPSASDVEDNILPPWRERGLKKWVKISNEAGSPEKVKEGRFEVAVLAEKTSTSITARSGEWKRPEATKMLKNCA